MLPDLAHVPLQAQQNFELAWRFGWYEEVSFWRAAAASAGAPGEAQYGGDVAAAAADPAPHTCLQGLASFKTLAYQAQARYGFLPAAAQVPLEGDAKARAQSALDEATASMLAPEPHDVSALVQQCLCKMGDLARRVPCQLVALVTLPGMHTQSGLCRSARYTSIAKTA
jgi:hypothetical protein